jgi:hypothetical protein
MAAGGTAQTRAGVEKGGTDAMSTPRDRIITPRIVPFPFFTQQPASIIKSMPMGLTFITTPTFYFPTFHPENRGESL